MSDARLILASADPEELAELRALLADAPVELVDAGPELAEALAPPAGGDYAARASQRARACAEAGGAPALALCAGVEVYALDLQPGALTEAFHAGLPATERCRALLDRLAATPPGQRIAVGRAAAALAAPGESPAVSSSIVECEIPTEPRGDGGHSLDAVTQLVSGQTLAELPEAERHRLGHRGKAVRPLLRRLG